MSAPTTQTITHTRGDDFDRVITFSEDPSAFLGIWFTVRAAWAESEGDDSDAISQAELGDGIAVTGALTVAIVIPSSETVGWVDDSYVYDIQVLTSTNKIRTTQRGSLRIQPDVTRATTP